MNSEWRTGWRLSDQHKEYSINVSLPCDAHSALYEASLIPDPYFGRNEYALRWIAERDWILEKEFDVQSTQFDLVISELDTVASVYINDQAILLAQNQFRRYRIDASDTLQTGTNTLRIVIASSIKMAALKQIGQPWVVPWHEGNSPIPNGNMLRKVQCDFGWDWNIALAPLGLYGDCFLQTRNTQRIEHIDITQAFSNQQQRVVVLVKAEICCSNAEPCSVIATLCGQLVEVLLGTTDFKINSSSYKAVAELTFTIEQPELWWPSGLGNPTLHQLDLKTNTDNQTRDIGFRTIELVTEPDDQSKLTTNTASTEKILVKSLLSGGTSFYFRVNGIAVFARGANWIPADALPARISRDKTRHLLESAVDANMNMVRVWGGGRYEADSFYQSCDELGLLVWQDFMFACNLYPHTEDFLDEVRAEVKDAVKRLKHHACIALWCGDNELVGALTWFDESINNRDRYLVAYDRLNHSIERTLIENAPDANWWPSSPSSGPLNYGDAWHDDQSGDMHFWSVWHEGRDFEHYRNIRPRFCSEFGFQSYPSLDVIKTFTERSDRNIASPVMESHQKNAGGNARIAETMFRYFRFPEGFENFVYLSQVQQGVAIKTAVDYWRSLKPHCMGSLYWQLNDTWPVASWSSLNYGGSWKLLHHMAKRFFKPITIVAIPDKQGWTFTAISDALHPISVSFIIGAVSIGGEKRVLLNGSAAVQNERNSHLAYIPAEDVAENEFLYWIWGDDFKDNSSTTSNTTTNYDATITDGIVENANHITSDQQNVDLLSPRSFKSYDLPMPGIRLESSKTKTGWVLELTSVHIALFVTIESCDSGQFSDNAFTLLPDVKKRLEFQPEQVLSPEHQPHFSIRDLYSATCSQNDI